MHGVLHSNTNMQCKALYLPISSQHFWTSISDSITDNGSKILPYSELIISKIYLKAAAA